MSEFGSSKNKPGLVSRLGITAALALGAGACSSDISHSTGTLRDSIVAAMRDEEALSEQYAIEQAEVAHYEAMPELRDLLSEALANYTELSTNREKIDFIRDLIGTYSEVISPAYIVSSEGSGHESRHTGVNTPGTWGMDSSDSCTIGWGFRAPIEGIFDHKGPRPFVSTRVVAQEEIREKAEVYLIADPYADFLVIGSSEGGNKGSNKKISVLTEESLPDDIQVAAEFVFYVLDSLAESPECPNPIEAIRALGYIV